MLQSIRSRIVLLTALSALPALCIFVYSGWELRQQRVTDATANMLLLAKGMADILHRRAESTHHLLEALALMDGVRTRDGEACTRLFAQFMKTHPGFTNILAVAPDGEVFASGVPYDSVNLSDRKHIRDALASKRFSAGEYIVSRTTGDPAFPFTLPVLDEAGNVAVILIASFKLSSFENYLQEVGAPQQVIVGITDHVGIRLFYHPPASTNQLGRPISKDSWQAISTPSEDEGVTLQVGSDGVERFFGWKRLRLRKNEPPFIYCVAGLPKTMVLAASQEITRRNIGLWLLAVLLGGGGAYLYGNAVLVRQLGAIARAAHRLGQGEFEARTGLPHHTGDLGQLALTFDAMAEKIQSHDAERTRAEEALRLSEERFRKLLDEVETVAVQGYTDEGNVQYWNRASELLYGYTAAEAMGRNLVDLIIPPFMRAEVTEHIRRMATTDYVIPAGELVLQRKDGSQAPVFSSHVRVHVGPRLEMFCLDVDLTELKRAEAIRARDAAQAANRAKSVFLANMSHEIRTPLNGILGMLQLLQLSSLTQEQLLFVDKAILSTKRLTRLLADILDLSQVESGRMTLQPAPFAVLELREAVLELFATPAAQKGLTLEVIIDPATPAVLEGDEVRLRQILFNLVSNAVKFTEHGGIRVEIQPVSAPGLAPVRLLLSVCDTGIGIPPERLGELFSPFAQLEPNQPRPDRGTGLGLAIVRRLADLMHGHITVDTAPGQGACIHVLTQLALPAEPEAARHLTSRPVTDQSPMIPLRLLLAEDDEMSRMVAQHILTQSGHAVTCAENGQQVLALLKDQPFDCILMDIEMPRLDGLEATRCIRSGQAGETWRNIPIIALTAHAMQGDRERLLAAGMNGYLEKPLTVDKLQQTLAKTLRPAQGIERAAGAGPAG